MPRRLLLLLPALAVAAAGGWYLSRPAPLDDTQQIRALFEEATRAAEERRAGDVVACLAEDFRGRGGGGEGLGGAGVDKQEARRTVAALTLRGAWVAVKLAGAEVQVEGDSATARVVVVLSRGGAGKGLADLLPSEASAVRFDCRLARRPEGWRVVEAGWVEIPLSEALAGEAPPR